jgi:hypothetical protein
LYKGVLPWYLIVYIDLINLLYCSVFALFPFTHYCSTAFCGLPCAIFIHNLFSYCLTQSFFPSSQLSPASPPQSLRYHHVYVCVCVCVCAHHLLISYFIWYTDTLHLTYSTLPQSMKYALLSLFFKKCTAKLQRN